MTYAQVVEYARAFTPVDGGAAAMAIVTPMRSAHIIRLSDDGHRVASPMRWGFSGRHDKVPNRPRHMHARAETAEKLATFRDAFQNGRGILIVNTFNEGEEMANGRTKQWRVTPKDGAPLAIAVLCEEWKNEAQSLWTFVMVSVPANALLAQVTDRMPAILRSEDWGKWLGEEDASTDDLKALLRTYDDAGNWDFAPEKPDKPKAQSDLFQ